MWMVTASCTTAFNQAIGDWDTSSVMFMHGMFDDGMFSRMFFVAPAFNQDLSDWCVTMIKWEPNNFSSGSVLTAGNHPVWGTCP